MSYILSALRRAEAERRAAQDDGRSQLVALDADIAAGDDRRVSPFLALAVLVVIALLMVGYWLLPLSRPAPVADPVAAPVPTLPAAPVAAEPTQPTQPIQTHIQTTRPAPPVQKQLSPPPAAPAPAEPAVAPSPPLPAINVTGYIYFEDKPENSKLFVDGIVYRLHSRLAEGLTVEGFQPDVVIVNYRGQQRQLRVR